jgi:L-iditol 2-dehydrogenase
MAKGHRAKGLTCDGGFAEYAVNHVNTLYKLPDNLTFEQACMVTTAASPLWAIDLMGGYLAGETVLVQAGTSGVGIAHREPGDKQAPCHCPSLLACCAGNQNGRF